MKKVKPTTTDFIFVPFTDEQVESLNAYQVSGFFHPFTCGNDDCPGQDITVLIDEVEQPLHISSELVASNKGWSCPVCTYRQTWAWIWMSDWTWKEAQEENDKAIQALINLEGKDEEA